MRFKIGDKVKLNPNRKQPALYIANIGFEKEYTVINIKKGFLDHFVFLDNDCEYSSYAYRLMKVGIKIK